MKLLKADKNETPKCPHCEEDLNTIKTKRFDKGFFKVTEKYVYFCPNCKKVLGIGQSAWMT